MATRFFSRPSASLNRKKPVSWRPQSILPGFSATFGLTVFYLSVVVLLPVATLFLKLSSFTIGEIWQEMASPRAVASYKLTLGCSFVAAAINTVMGLVIAWVLTRGEFWGRRLMDAMIDIPFALPTAVAGLAITAVYAPTGWMGKHMAAWGFPASYTPLGIVIAVMFVGLPFVVRTVQPVLLDLDVEIEEASLSLGATNWKTFQRVIFPVVFPSLLTGFAMAFSRGLGEFGAVIFIAGNLPMKTEITPLVIVTKLDEYNIVGANALALVLLAAAFVLLLIINSLHAWNRRYQESRIQPS